MNGQRGNFPNEIKSESTQQPHRHVNSQTHLTAVAAAAITMFSVFSPYRNENNFNLSLQVPAQPLWHQIIVTRTHAHSLFLFLFVSLSLRPVIHLCRHGNLVFMFVECNVLSIHLQSFFFVLLLFIFLFSVAAAVLTVTCKQTTVARYSSGPDTPAHRQHEQNMNKQQNDIKSLTD